MCHKKTIENLLWQAFQKAMPISKVKQNFLNLVKEMEKDEETIAIKKRKNHETFLHY